MNGGIIGAVNTPTLASATGVWDIEELKLAQQQGTWPLLKQPDPDFEYVSLLLSSETAVTNGAQNNTFQDSSTNNFTITRNGNTTQGSFSPYGANWSNYFDGTAYLTVDDNANLQFGTSPFTIECWIYISTAGAQTIVCKGSDSNTGWLFRVNSSNQLVFISGSTLYTYTTQSVILNSWNHVVCMRTTNNEIILAVNGLLSESLGTVSANYNQTNLLSIGAGRPTSHVNRITGYISNLRIVKGTAIYTANFTPPTSPLTAIAGTSLLTCQSNRFVDASTNNFTITINGDTRITPFSPFSSFAATKGYVPATYGGSAYFDGSGDFLTAVGSGSVVRSSGSFTIEGWYYPTSSASSFRAVYSSGTGYATAGRLYQNNTSLTFYWTASSSVSGSIPWTVNSWNHFAVTWDGTTTKVYVNGQQTISSTSPTYSGTVDISVGTSTYSPFGYISNFRIANSVIYTSNFTPPTSPLTAISGTQLLANFTNGGIIDSAALNVAETVGNAQVSTSVRKYGSGSYYFDGTGDWFTIIDKPELRFGTDAFTIEFWLYLGATGAARGIIGKGTASTGWLISTDSSNKVVFTYDSSTIISTGALLGATWYFITVVRQGTGSNQTKIYINGINDGTGTVSTAFTQTNIMYVGANRTGGNALNGYISDLRITNGLARYTANFTPPIASLPIF